MTSVAPEPLLKAEALSVAFGTGSTWLRAVDDVSFELGTGETLALVGESGSGKSATALSIGRLHGLSGDVRETGSLTYRTRDGVDVALDRVSGEALRRLRGREIAIVFQDPGSALDPAFTIGDQLAETLRHLLGLSRADARAGAISLLDRVGIPDPHRRVDEYPHQLSGGMRQRAVIALALAGKPRLLILDEPTTALDVTIQAQVVELLLDLQAREGLAMIFVSHDLGLVAGLAHRLCVLYAGQVVEEGLAAEVFASPRHPYTRALLQCVPTFEDGEPPPRGIPGRMPSPATLPDHCRFADRCALAGPDCRLSPVPLFDVAPGWKSRCLRWRELQ
jgi:oligopeptide/dipeptide ABC transporter ATP-binding protein